MRKIEQAYIQALKACFSSFDVLTKQARSADYLYAMKAMTCKRKIHLGKRESWNKTREPLHRHAKRSEVSLALISASNILARSASPIIPKQANVLSSKTKALARQYRNKYPRIDTPEPKFRQCLVAG
ncbi:MAG: hypothetical protein ACJAUM_003123 [Pseudomonadales bacterium]|jgi:hypothetical protein